MTRTDTGGRSRRPLTFVLLAVGLAVAVAGTAAWAAFEGASAAPSAAIETASDAEWSNGQVLCIFDPTAPSVAVSLLGLSDSGLNLSMSGVSEVNASGVPVAVASMAGASWTAWNASTDDTYDQAYETTVPVVAPNSPTTSLGSADLRVDYTLPAYSETGASSLNTVTAEFGVSNWTWQSSADRLVLTLPLWPTFAQSEHLTAPAANGSEVTSWSTATGAAREEFRLSDNATATSESGLVRLLGVSSSVTLHPSLATVNVTLSPSPGNHTSILYNASVTVPLPATIAGLPLYDYALVAGVAVLLSILVAVGTRRVRQRPSDLEYVDPGGEP